MRQQLMDEQIPDWRAHHHAIDVFYAHEARSIHRLAPADEAHHRVLDARLALLPHPTVTASVSPLDMRSGDRLGHRHSFRLLDVASRILVHAGRDDLAEGIHKAAFEGLRSDVLSRWRATTQTALVDARGEVLDLNARALLMRVLQELTLFHVHWRDAQSRKTMAHACTRVAYALEIVEAGLTVWQQTGAVHWIPPSSFRHFEADVKDAQSGPLPDSVRTSVRKVLTGKAHES